MRPTRRTTLSVLAIASSAIVSTGCGSGSTSSPGGAGHYDPSAGAAGDDGTSTASSSGGSAAPAPGPGGTTPTAMDDAGTTADASALDPRVVDYGEALRTASLKLVGNLPTLAQIQAIEAATTPAAQATIYDADVDAMLADPRFASQMIQYFRDTFKTGMPYSPMPKGAPSFDTAATFAAMVVVNEQPFTDILTAATGTCPTFANGTFTAASCTNNAPTSGVLTDPGIQAQYFEDLAFRRVRFIQEIFVCSPMPAEYSANPVPMGQSLYTSPWPFDSIAGGPTANINFQDTSAVICANCHTTLNHIAPLFAYFDANGKYQTTIQVQTPIVPPVTSVLTDWLPAGQGFAWRNGVPVTDIPSLGQAIAADPDVAQCAVNRVWDWAFNRGDIVNDLATIPAEVTAPVVTDFTAKQMNLKQAIRDIFTSDDFVRF
ncbi:MAG: hypothetical protein ABSE49_08175 [Polyangiaceae bacterium]